MISVSAHLLPCNTLQHPRSRRWGMRGQQPSRRAHSVAAIKSGSPPAEDEGGGAAGGKGGGGSGAGGLLLAPLQALERSLDPSTHLLADLCGPQFAAASCLVEHLQYLAEAERARKPPAEARKWAWRTDSSGPAAVSIPPPLLWHTISKSLYCTALACQAQHGFAPSRHAELAAAVGAQLVDCRELCRVR